jgi:hypothetical protein
LGNLCNLFRASNTTECNSKERKGEPLMNGINGTEVARQERVQEESSLYKNIMEFRKFCETILRSSVYSDSRQTPPLPTQSLSLDTLKSSNPSRDLDKTVGAHIGVYYLFCTQCGRLNAQYLSLERAQECQLVSLCTACGNGLEVFI